MHHTGGAYTPSALDLNHYHFVVDGVGAVHKGRFAVSANAPGARMAPGTYAAHTRGLNTSAIGVAVAAMAGAQWRDPRGTTRFPVMAAQVDSLVGVCAELCVEYGIRPAPETVLSHAEVELTLGVKQAGKWDFDYDPLFVSPTRDPRAVGDALRHGIARAMRGVSAPPRPVPPARRALRRGDQGDDVAAVQRALGITKDGVFDPATDTAVRRFQTRHQLVPDGIVGDVTRAALGL